LELGGEALGYGCCLVAGPVESSVYSTLNSSSYWVEEGCDYQPLCGFADPEAAAAALRNAYPHVPEDEHLGSCVAEVAADASV